MKSCGLVAADKVCYHRVVTGQSGDLCCSVFDITEYSSVIYIKSLSLSFRSLGYLDGQTKEVKPHRESSCYEKFLHKNNLRSTKRKCQNSPKYQSGILDDILRNLSSKNNDFL